MCFLSYTRYLTVRLYIWVRVLGYELEQDLRLMNLIDYKEYSVTSSRRYNLATKNISLYRIYRYIRYYVNHLSNILGVRLLRSIASSSCSSLLIDLK
jgi:hypothetical protein